MTTASEDIVASCERHWNEFKGDCSGFVKAVAHDLVDFVPPGVADNIIEFCRESGDWARLGNDRNAALKAVRNAQAGQLVVAGLRSSEMNPARTHGHVVVVVPGSLVDDKYPRAYWGSLNSVGDKDAGINHAFGANDKDRIEYFSRPVDKDASAAAGATGASKGFFARGMDKVRSVWSHGQGKGA